MTHEIIPFDPDFDLPAGKAGAPSGGTPPKVAFAFGFVAAVAVAAILALLLVL